MCQPKHNVEKVKPTEEYKKAPGLFTRGFKKEGYDETEEERHALSIDT